MGLSITFSPETSTLTPVVTGSGSVLNNFHGHRLRYEDVASLGNFIALEIIPIRFKLAELNQEPIVFERETDFKKLFQRYCDSLATPTSLMTRGMAHVGIISSLAFLPVANVLALYAAYKIISGVHYQAAELPVIKETLTQLIEEVWKGIDSAENTKRLSEGKVRVFGFITDQQTSQDFLLHIRMMVIAGKIFLMGLKFEENAILKVFSEFIRFEKEDLKKLTVTSPEECHYYADGALCEIYSEIFNQQRNQWSDTEKLKNIIEIVAAHARRRGEIPTEVENEEFPYYFAPKPQSHRLEADDIDAFVLL